MTYPLLHSYPETKSLGRKLRNPFSPQESMPAKPQPDLTSGSKQPAMAQGSCRVPHTRVMGHTGIWEHQSGCESTVWVRATA